MRKATSAVLAAAVLLIAAACGSSDETVEPASPRHNAADVSFAQMMIPHHEQAIEMSRLAPSRASSQDVKDLATAIEGAQDPEIKAMKAWLKAWGEDESGHMGHDMAGMMDDKTMVDLEKGKGAAFDRQFLTAMIAHHKGAIAMATSEKSDGVNPKALKLANAIIRTQTAEIQKMQAMLG
jgi:uncharacterized protein (DUF305 family)